MDKKKVMIVPLPLPEEGFVRLPQILHALGIGRTTFLEGVKSGQFPKPRELGKRTKLWRVEEIRELIHRIGQDDNHE